MCALERMIRRSGVSSRFSPVPTSRPLSHGNNCFTILSFFLNSHPHSESHREAEAPGCPGSPHRRTVLFQEDWLSLKQLDCSSWHHNEILDATWLALSSGKMGRSTDCKPLPRGVCLLRRTPPRRGGSHGLCWAPQIHMLEPYPRWEGIWRWGLWEEMRFCWGHEGGAPTMRLVSS